MAEHFTMDGTTVPGKDNQHNSVPGRDGLEREEALHAMFVGDGFLHPYHFHQNPPTLQARRWEG